jgi:hypothetical protein
VRIAKSRVIWVARGFLRVLLHRRTPLQKNAWPFRQMPDSVDTTIPGIQENDEFSQGLARMASTPFYLALRSLRSCLSSTHGFSLVSQDLNPSPRAAGHVLRRECRRTCEAMAGFAPHGLKAVAQRGRA